MKTTEQKMKDLIQRHAFLLYSNYKNHSRLTSESIDRIEREYIILTGYEIRDNPEHRKLIDQYEKNLQGHETV